ncbi:protein MIS12 homolog [Melopsittacus undulatus]|uniref:Protein MIS12 homolog n=1 Tax=Melopsittacus undulatus TaxID=13146 RepID=A0A8C6JIA8_MELUD|nr:protein MIS12 homolog [Melopsittacus undulatus]XP_030910980.1 protein MIS12 homolog [Melopsittacus undulatus]XP_030910981.1 protein MIS12 homolog [Melopsittacus undulatus]XP_030910982.1 protein MIS12 homolog [Melopsittacus undulatus]
MAINPMTYEAQFFGFTPQTFIQRLYTACQDCIFDAMLQVETVILKKLEELPECGISPLHIRRGTEKFLLFLTENFNELFGKMEEMLLQLVLNIPKNVLLPEDKVHKQYPYSKEQVQALQDEIHQLQEQYRAEVCAGQVLRAELEEQEIVRAELEKILQCCVEFENICREHWNCSFGESFAFLTPRVKKLQDALKNVKQKSKKLKKCDTES